MEVQAVEISKEYGGRKDRNEIVRKHPVEKKSDMNWFLKNVIGIRWVERRGLEWSAGA